MISAPPGEAPKGAAVDLPVAFEGRGALSPAPGKGRGVEDDAVEALARGHRGLQVGKDVFPHQIQIFQVIEQAIFPGHFQGRGGNSPPG